MMITILKYFTFAAASGQTFTSDWFQLPAGNQIWQIVVLIHSRISTTAGTAQMQTSWDSAKESNIGSTANLATLGLAPQDITSGMGPLVRVVLTASGGSDTAVTLSIWATAKTT